ncbi:putative nuclease HARBI1 [Gigantopelta aegis]|uniref:putative nuclease HARBI1 n=1 Tax=Gigantopelta aegis TaxID=1735272 RepID=UPI001B88A7E7|nr:putative nuclease HARBI1 [Gigantopelta aegis]
MDYELYQEILQCIEGRITRQDTSYRKSLSPGLKLAITLRYLSAGDSYHSLMYGFRVAHNTISKLIREVCEAIIAEFAEELIPCPTTTDEWKDIAKHFSDKWQFLHCLGALDGKHIAIKCPKGGGSLYYNYKGFHSSILMALVDGDYKFTWVEVGSHGSAGDAQVFNNSELKEAIDKGVLHFPPSDPLPDDDTEMPYFIAADDASP